MRVRLYAEIAASVAIVVLAATSCMYRDAAREAQQSIKRTEDMATAEYARLKASNDRLQGEYRDYRQISDTEIAQREVDNAALRSELDARPIRVRIQPQVCSSGATPAGQPGSSAGGDPADPGAAGGLLPADNSRRLAKSLGEVEQMSTAYAACKPLLTTLFDMLGQSRSTAD